MAKDESDKAHQVVTDISVKPNNEATDTAVKVTAHRRSKPGPRQKNGKKIDPRAPNQPRDFDDEPPPITAKAVAELEQEADKPQAEGGGTREKQAIVKPPIREAKKSPANAHTSPREIEHQEKVSTALEYRRMGHSYPVIAKEMEISVGYAYELVAEGLHNIITEPATELYTLEMERYNEQLASIYAAAAGGDIKAIETCLKIQERLEKLVGLERASDLAAARGVTVNNNILIRLVGMDDNDDDLK